MLLSKSVLKNISDKNEDLAVITMIICKFYKHHKSKLKCLLIDYFNA